MFVLGRKQFWEDIIGETAIKLRTIYILPYKVWIYVVYCYSLFGIYIYIYTKVTSLTEISQLFSFDNGSDDI